MQHLFDAEGRLLASGDFGFNCSCVELCYWDDESYSRIVAIAVLMDFREQSWRGYPNIIGWQLSAEPRAPGAGLMNPPPNRYWRVQHHRADEPVCVVPPESERQETVISRLQGSLGLARGGQHWFIGTVVDRVHGSPRLAEFQGPYWLVGGLATVDPFPLRCELHAGLEPGCTVMFASRCEGALPAIALRTDEVDAWTPA